MVAVRRSQGVDRSMPTAYGTCSWPCELGELGPDSLSLDRCADDGPRSLKRIRVDVVEGPLFLIAVLVRLGFLKDSPSELLFSMEGPLHWSLKVLSFSV